MLTELHVRDLGVIAELRLGFGPGLTAVTGETGAGKTLIITAISLLMGGRADASMVRPGAAEALVEARFELGDSDHVLRRVIPAEGRSRAYIDGSLATLAELGALGAALVDLHGQRDHQSLLSPAVQRRALDRFGQIDLEPLQQTRRRLSSIEAELVALGGDERERARELDLLRFQVAELDRADIRSESEDDDLRAEAELLADATGHREAAERAAHLLSADDGALDQVSAALAAIAGRAPFTEQAAVLDGLRTGLGEVAAELRRSGETIEADPERLAAIGERRRLLQELRRKYGDTLTEVLAWRAEARSRLDALENRDSTAAALDAERVAVLAAIAEQEAVVGAARRRAAPELARRVVAGLPELALPNARVEVAVPPEGAGDEVAFLFSANPGMPLQPLSKVASGGESARAMLALRLVLSDGPPVQIFDEVDAGIGGAAALAVGSALAEVARHHQVLVVTHLAQVAAWADAQVVVDKMVTGGSTTTTVAVVDAEERIAELARMLSGTPESPTARQHAREMLEGCGH
ncbi:MAG: DNA repair protein RecN [Acidobacteria bacterium]|nr:DNA repair protein RecN [Acidobacteriota bacterium]